MTDNDKYKVISLLQANTPPKDIAEDLNLSYGGVLKLNREYKDALVNNTLDKLIDTDKLLLAKVGEELSDVVDTEAAVTNLTQGLEGIERLSTDLQKTALGLSKRVEAMILSSEYLPDLKIASEILCDLQMAFVNKNLTQVNVQNNFGASTPKYTQFLSDKVAN